MLNGSRPVHSQRRDGLRVLYVCTSPRGGTPQYVHNLATRIASRGHVVSLLTSVGGELASLASNYTAIEAFDRMRPRPMRLWRAWRHLRATRPQVIHYQGGQHPDLLLLLDLGIRGHAAAVYTPQELRSNTPRRHHAQAMDRLISRMDYVYFNSTENRDFVRTSLGNRLPAHGVFLVPDLMEFTRHDLVAQVAPVPQGRRLLLCFGLIEPRKGIAPLLEAFAQVRKRVPDAHLAIVGKPLMDLSPLHELVARHDMADAVDIVATYVSFEALAGWFERAEVVVLPYESGWNSGVVPVANGYRKPMVATSLAAGDGAIQHGRTGLVVPPSDGPALVAALERMLLDTALRDAMQPHLEAAAQACGWNALVDDTEATYLRLAGKGS